ncbi:c-type cytochrome [Sphingomonas sp. MMS12-HWE2-04]|uniref:c-type cytochrome n=1 Tax=Sphingomonas sp. MMS12-HWE2-04 TaxID=3234199 RepID=UPI00384BA6AC
MKMLGAAFSVAGGVLLSAPSFVARAVSPDAPAPNAFNQCRTCHVAAPGLKPLLGPNLFGVVGSRAGSRSDYAYSSGMKASGIVWNTQNLDAFLANPQRMIRGTKMTYFGEKDPVRRRAIVVYLETLR